MTKIGTKLPRADYTISRIIWRQCYLVAQCSYMISLGNFMRYIHYQTFKGLSTLVFRYIALSTDVTYR